jgi:hypothetical protein
MATGEASWVPPPETAPHKTERGSGNAQYIPDRLIVFCWLVSDRLGAGPMLTKHKLKLKPLACGECISSDSKDFVDRSISDQNLSYLLSIYSLHDRVPTVTTASASVPRHD